MVSDGPFGGFRADSGPSKLFHAHPEALIVLNFFYESSGARLRPIFGPFWDRPWLNYLRPLCTVRAITRLSFELQSSRSVQIDQRDEI